MYYPILKSKRGEFLSLRELTDENKQLVTPYIEVIAESSDMTHDQLVRVWNFDDNQVILDSTLFFDENNGADDFIELLERLLEGGVNVIPAIEFDSSGDYLNSIKSLIIENDLNVCIRIRNRFLRPRTLISNIEALLLEYEIPSSRLILLFDFGYVIASNVEASTDKALECLEALGDLTNYSAVVVASGSFPENLTNILADTRRLLTRYEWQLWNAVIGEFEREEVSYADYGIKHPVLDIGVARFEGTCSVKYTTNTSYLIYRGIRASDHRLGGGQYHEKCQLLLADPNYDGEHFSWGDSKIAECSRRDEHPGNAESWVKIGHSHHITKILSLL